MMKHLSKLLHYIHRSSSHHIRCINSTDQGEITNNSRVDIELTDNNDEMIQIDRHDAITIIGLNRRHKRNAINQHMALKLCEAITNFENDDSSTVGVLHGMGGSFSSGYDMNDLQGDTIKMENLMNSEGTVGPTRRIIKKPMVCAISGFCIANGLELALMCDMRVIEEDAFVGFLNRRFGIPLMDGGTVRLPAIIGLARALELILTGRVVSAKEVFEMGLANHIVAPGSSLGKSVNLARSVAKFPQASLNHDRNAIYKSAFEMKSFDESCMNEIMSLSRDVVDEMKEGAEKFKSGSGRGGAHIDMKERTMADWELREYRRELKKKFFKVEDDDNDKDKDNEYKT